MTEATIDTAAQGTLYCPACRAHFMSDDETRPPYGAMEVGGMHVHPITRTPLRPVSPEGAGS